MPQYLTAPANSILAKGDPMILEYEIGANATAAQMIAGRVVIHDTTDGDVKEAGSKALNPLGVLMEKPDQLEETAYAVGDQARVIIDGPAIVKLTITSTGSGSVAPGDWLVCAANGKVSKDAVGTMGGQGARVGQALGSWTQSLTDGEILVNFKITPDARAAS